MNNSSIINKLEMIEKLRNFDGEAIDSFGTQKVGQRGKVCEKIVSAAGMTRAPSRMLSDFYSYSWGWELADWLLVWFSPDEMAEYYNSENFKMWLQEDIENDFEAPAGCKLEEIFIFAVEKEGEEFRIYLHWPKDREEPMLVEYGTEIRRYDNLNEYLSGVLLGLVNSVTGAEI